ncbi:proline-rich receptor-like protein kinase PERK14 [Punica granatum]|uniref:Proline-rich receptor-like protein kinase PERK14 n=2 Tax=Punica granatum TaxID=22663 RepID=A0A6P8DRJ4_PUNGR|nr:proline-rich receptor-like protein kinase PERK14 [Punica granatum]PKI50742.1 hypothetical protein CRG98_028884 [Punica granatum]
MRNAGNNTAAAFETINAAAAAIITADSRAQPAAAQKRRWGSCWNLYRCFGHHRTSKRIGHAVLVPEPILPPPPAPDAQPSGATVVPFIAPPSSPASFLQSDPPSITQSPTKLLSLAALSAQSHSSGGSAPVFSIGPYAYETQLVSPPVFSTFTTEPSTAAYTPPPESVQATTPSSPEVPFAQLLASSLERARKNGVPCQFYYPGSPGSQLKSPGSGVSNSGTSSPFPEKPPVRVPGFEHSSYRKWGSRLGSGSLTPDGAGLRSRLGSGSLTPCQETFPVDEQIIAKVGSAFNSPGRSRNDEDNAVTSHHRVSFELTGEDVARCLESKSAATSFRALQEFPDGEALDSSIENHHSVSVQSAKEFNFVNTTRDYDAKPEPVTGAEWWANEKAAARDSKSRNSWSFFPFLGPQAS